MTYRKKRNNSHSKPLTLSDGTEVYEISESFSVNSLIDISFSRSRPVRSRHQAELRSLDSHIVEETINTELAKLNYIGCSLTAPDNEINKRINACFNEEENKLYLYKDAKNREKIDREREKSPYILYNNLMQQLSNFANDLKQYGAADSNIDIDPIDKSNVRLLSVAVQNLNNKLRAIGKNDKYQNILQKDYKRYDNINNALNEKIENISNGNPENLIKKLDNNSDDTAHSDDTWFLYEKNKRIKTMGTSDSQFLDIESRTSKLENCIGFVTDMKNPYPDTLHAVDLLESRFEYVFGSSWINIKQQANKMMNDLKNIKYHLDLMQARYKPTEKQTRMEWEKLEDLWIMMNKWDKVVFQLINIVKRLKSLQNYHYRTCLFIKRVNTIYNQQCFIYQSLKNDEKTLQKCLKSMQINTKQLNKNAMYLTQRLSVIAAKLSQ